MTDVTSKTDVTTEKWGGVDKLAAMQEVVDLQYSMALVRFMLTQHFLLNDTVFPLQLERSS
jgi:hypothetical protein